MNARFVALVAGVVFFVRWRSVVQGLLPFLHPASRTTKVTPVVRTDLGELKWMRDRRHRLHAARAARPATSTSARAAGTATRSSCARSPARRGAGARSARPASTPSTCRICSRTRRIGPDLTRVGLKYSDEWHLAHFWDPRMLSPDSIMPRFVGLFDAPDERVAIVDDAAGNTDARAQRRSTESALRLRRAQQQISADARTPRACCSCRERGKYPVIFTPNEEFTGDDASSSPSRPRSWRR